MLIPSLGQYDEAKPVLEGYKVLTGEPLSAWNHAATYDTAAECETDKNVRIQIEHSAYTRASEEYRRFLSEMADPQTLKVRRLFMERDNAQTNALLSGRCIGSDDPRLR